MERPGKIGSRCLAARLPSTVKADLVIHRAAWLRSTLPYVLISRPLHILLNRLLTIYQKYKNNKNLTEDQFWIKNYTEPHQRGDLDFAVFFVQFSTLSLLIDAPSRTTNLFLFLAAWFFFSLFSISLVSYLFFKIVDGNIRKYIAALSESRVRLLLTAIYFLGGLGAIYYDGKGTIWRLVPNAALITWAIPLLTMDIISAIRRRRSRRKHLNQLSVQSVQPSSFVLQARSLDELYYWIVDKRQPIAYSSEFTRSL